MQVNKPLVSIGVGSYNNAKYIIETLDSINGQTYQTIELIIVDDCSTDNSPELIQNWLRNSKFPVKFMQNEKNLGIPRVCNKLLSGVSAESKYLCLFSSDDLFTTNRIEKQVEILERSAANIVGTFGDAEIINETGDKLLDSYYIMRGADFEYYSNLFFKADSNQIIQELIANNRLPALTVMYKIEIIRQFGGWNENFFIEDLDMNLQLIKAGYGFIPTTDLLAKHRKHPTSVTNEMRVGYLTSILEIVSKYKGISTEIDKSIAKNFNEYALAVYQRNGAKSTIFLKEKYKFNKSLKNYFLYKISSMGIPFSKIKAFYYLFSRNRPPLNGKSQ